LAHRAAMVAGVDNLIEFTTGDAGDFSHPALAAAHARDAENDEDMTTDLNDMGPVTLRPGGGGILVVSNPPWGKRIGGEDSNSDRGGGSGGGSGGFAGRERRSGGGGGGDAARYSDDGEFGGGDVNFDTRGRDGFQANADWDETIPGGGGSNGERTGADAESMDRNTGNVEEAWGSLGTFFRRECGGATAHLLSGDAAATRPLRMRANRKHVLGIGGALYKSPFTRCIES
jgi:23S rRNA G2445 N2-methylase RlmL